MEGIEILRRRRRPLVIVIIALVSVGLAHSVGCSRTAEIRAYTVHHPAPTHRMLGAIIPRRDQAWFFKVAGPIDALAEQADSFRTLIKSVRFDDQGTPAWELPEGWSEEAASGIRFATLQMNSSGEPLEVTVTRLPVTPGSLDAYLVSNINRWREQLQLQRISPEQLANDTEELDLDGHTATLVNLVGMMSAGAPMSSAPLAGGGIGGEAAPARAATKPAITYETPSGWSPGQLVVSRGGIQVPRQAAFEVTEGDKRIEITVTGLGGTRAMLLANINRWRQQIGLEEIDQAVLEDEAEPIEFAGVAADYVQLMGDQQAILGVVAFRQDRAWFIKLQGDRALAEREQSHFESFVKSIQISE